MPKAIYWTLPAFVVLSLWVEAPFAAGEAVQPPQPPAAKKPVATAKPDPKSADPVLSPEEIQRSFDEGAYERTIQSINKALTLKGKVAEPFDRYSLLMLKGSAQLKLKASSPAIQAFTEAAKETEDEKMKATARATAVLIKRSKGLVYTSKTDQKNGGGIDITDPANRVKALKELWAEEGGRLPDLDKKAANQRVLPSLLDAIEQIDSIRDLEVAATGADVQADKAILDISERAFRLMDTEVTRMTKRNSAIALLAETMIRPRAGFGGQPGGGADSEFVRRRGLSRDDFAELRGLVKNAKDIAAAAETFGKIAHRSEAAESISQNAEDVAEAARRTIERDWIGARFS